VYRYIGIDQFFVSGAPIKPKLIWVVGCAPLHRCRATQVAKTERTL